MSEPPPVDPYDAGQVAAVVEGTTLLMGTDGVLDLLARLPGVRVVAGEPRRLFHPAVPGAVWVGTEHLLTMTDPLVHEHRVGGVALRRAALAPGELATVVAGLVISLTRAQGSQAETAAVLTAARDVLGRL